MAGAHLVRLLAKLISQLRLKRRLRLFRADLDRARVGEQKYCDEKSQELRHLIRTIAGLQKDPHNANVADLLTECAFISHFASLLRPAFDAIKTKRVLFSGHCYYNTWYLSRALRNVGWKADVYNWDVSPGTQIYYHGQDYHLGGNIPNNTGGGLAFYVSALYKYDIVHFSNAHGISFGWGADEVLTTKFGKQAVATLFKQLGKKVAYTNNGCHDGVSQTTFSKWGPDSPCSTCRWQNEPLVCCDKRNLAWGRFRNSVADFQCNLGGNRADYNADPRVHEVPEFYCLDPNVWRPDLEIPKQYHLPELKDGGVRVYHAVGHRSERTRRDGANIKSSHIYLPLIEKLRNEGIQIDLIEPTGVPNLEVRFLQAQADIFLEMLTYGWFGANAREAMMLGKPVVCFIRPEWLEDVRREIPAYAEELPIVSATPETVETVLRDLIDDRARREKIGRRSRAFAVKWHSAKSGARRLDEIYSRLLNDDPQLLPAEWFARKEAM